MSISSRPNGQAAQGSLGDRYAVRGRIWQYALVGRSGESPAPLLLKCGRSA